MDLEGIYESGTEIYFNCIPSASGERNTWKIICENGHWIGRSYNCGRQILSTSSLRVNHIIFCLLSFKLMVLVCLRTMSRMSLVSTTTWRFARTSWNSHPVQLSSPGDRNFFSANINKAIISFV